MILDTNAMSALAGKSPSVLRKVREARKLATTLVSVGEYRYGIRRSRFRTELDGWLDAFLQRAELLVPDLATTDHYAELRMELKEAGTPIPANDCWIAAIARQHRMPVLSRDRHFDHVPGLRRVEW